MMPPLELRWDPRRCYRGFVHRPLEVATIVSSEIQSDARILELENLLLTADRRGYVCDLEITLGGASDADGGEIQENAVPSAQLALEPMRTHIDTAAPASIDLGGEWLRLSFGGHTQQGRWHRLGRDALFLRVAEDGALLSLTIAVADDPDGSVESRWLDEIEASTEDRTPCAS